MARHLIKNYVWALLVAAMGVFGAQDGNNRILAVVDKKVITELDLQQEIDGEIRRMLSLPGKTAQELMNEESELREHTLDHLINSELLYLEFKSIKGAAIPEVIIQERLDLACKEVAGGDIIAFEDKLYQAGMTMKEFREKIIREIAIEAMIHNRVRNGVSIPDTAVETYYRIHPQEFMNPPKYHVAVILIHDDENAKANCQKVKDELGRGTPFDEIARQFSQGANAEGGGDQGWMTSMAPQLKDAVVSLGKGNILMAPILIGKNYYFVRVLDVEGTEPPPLTPELRQTIKAKMTEMEYKQRLNDYLKELRMKYAVRRFDLQNTK